MWLGVETEMEMKEAADKCAKLKEQLLKRRLVQDIPFVDLRVSIKSTNEREEETKVNKYSRILRSSHRVDK